MAYLIPFPLAARADLVGSIVDDLDRLHGREADEFWRDRIAAIVTDLRASGIDDPTIRSAILDLQHAVQSELHARGERVG